MHEDQIRHLLGRLEDDRDPDPRFADALYARLNVAARGRRRSRAPMLLLAAALMTLLAGGVAIGSGRLPLPFIVDATTSPAPSASALAEPSVSVAPSTSAGPSVPPPSGSESAAPEVPILAGRILVAEAAGLRLRSTPSEEGDVLATLPSGTKMGATGEVEREWFEVRIGPGTLTGWVSAGPDRSWLRVVTDGAVAFHSSGPAEDQESGWVLATPPGDDTISQLAPDEVVELAWSPDGSNVAMTIAGSDGMALAIADWDGSNRRTIGPGGYGPSWAPDGRLAWSTAAGIVIADETLTPVVLATDLRNPGRPFWSPDSARLAILAMDCPECPLDEPIMGDVPGAVYVVDVATGAATKLTDPGYYGFGGWSADGGAITFTAIDLSGERPQQAFTVAVEGGTPAPLLEGGPVHEAPTWSPDGSRLAMGTPDGLVVMAGDGSSPSVLVPNTAFVSGVQWSPSGEWLIFQIGDGPDLGVWIVRADGSEPAQRVTATEVTAGSPTWQPLWEPLP